MTLLQFFIAVILFLDVTLVRTYSAPYEDIQLAFSTIPKLIYTDAESNPTFSGYSYATQDFNGGESNVVFTTGADSVNKLRNEMNSMKIPEKYSQRDKLDRTQENLVFSKQQSKSEKVEASINKDFNLNVEVKEEKKPSKNSEADNNFVEHQAFLQQISLDAPYPALKANLLNFDFPAVLPKYQISDVIQNQYYPHDPHAGLELPLDNFGFYNPAVPLFYEDTIPIPDNSFGHAPIIADVKTSIEPYVTKSLQTNATVSKSNAIESRFNQESTANTVVETSSKSDILDKLESTTTTERNKEETSESVKPTVTSKSSVEQTTENNSNTERASTEINLTEKSSTTPKI